VSTRILQGHALEVLRTLPSESVNCCVTSPPYWGLRDYGTPPMVWGGDPDCDHSWGDQVVVRDSRGPSVPGIDGRPNLRVGRDWDPTAGESKVKRDYLASTGCFCEKCGAWLGQLGLEPTPQLYVAHIVEVFEEVRRVLRKDGTLWINLGDSYATNAGKVGRCPGGGEQGERFLRAGHINTQPNRLPIPGLKPKDLVGIPWRVAFALQAAGWYLRSDIIWSKPNPMPESVRDRPTKAHEYVFLLSKSEKYWYDADAIAEPVTPSTVERLSQAGLPDQAGSSRVPGKRNGNIKALPSRVSARDNFRREGSKRAAVIPGQSVGTHRPDRQDSEPGGSRNKRTVWTISTRPYVDAHFAVYPEELPRTCILAGCVGGGVVLDTFAGSGTTGAVAEELGRDSILIDLNPDYIPLIEKRIAAVTPGFRFDAQEAV
jgi:DNA modification methylase